MITDENEADEIRKTVYSDRYQINHDLIVKIKDTIPKGIRILFEKR